MTVFVVAFCLMALPVLYYITPQKIRWISLLLASTVFFGLWCGWKLYLVFAVQAAAAYFAARFLSPDLTEGEKRTIAVLFLVGEAAILIMYKESVFFTDNINRVFRIFNVSIQIPKLDLIAPLGISYYTLMLISYFLDVYWGKTEAEKNPFKVMLYAGFFPQMISGPFSRYDEVKGTLFEGHRFDYNEVCFGAQRFLWGLFKKLVLAERLAVLASTVYDGGTPNQMGTVTFKGIYVLIGAVSYVLQLYTDFSGSMDIVLGAVQTMGIHLPENFNTPFYATSLSEIWRRWHMTLGRWLKDYVMYPLQKCLITKFGKFLRKKLGKKAGKDIILYASMFVAWFTIGFWHGGSWKYICGSGLFFFVMIVGGILLQPLFLRMQKLFCINMDAWSWRLFQRLRTFILFTLSVSIGRAESLTRGLQMWKRSFAYNPWVLVDGSLYNLGLDRADFWVLIFGLLLLFAVSKYQQKSSVRAAVARQNLLFRWIIWLGLFSIVLLFGMYGEGYDPAEFIYGGF